MREKLMQVIELVGYVDGTPNGKPSTMWIILDKIGRLDLDNLVLSPDFNLDEIDDGAEVTVVYGGVKLTEDTIHQVRTSTGIVIWEAKVAEQVV